MILFLDLETTGVDIETAHIVEYAAMEYGHTDNPLELSCSADDWSVGLVNPGVPIPPETSAVHHLVDADVQHSPTEDQAAGMLAEVQDGRVPAAICGHNVGAFDLPIARKRLGGWPPDAPVLDTYRLAMHVWPDLPSYKLEVLAYRFALHPRDVPDDLTRGGKAGQHSAAYDCVVAANLLRLIIDDVQSNMREEYHDLAGMVRLSAEHITVKKMRFGKHAGQFVRDLPRSYVDWLMKQPWMPTEQPDLYDTLKGL